MIRLRSKHSIHTQWKSKRMLALYVPSMRKGILDIKSANFSCRLQLSNTFALCIKACKRSIFYPNVNRNRFLFVRFISQLLRSSITHLIGQNK